MEKFEYDLYYVKHISVWIDLSIVFRTVRTILTGFGAREWARRTPCVGDLVIHASCDGWTFEGVKVGLVCPYCTLGIHFESADSSVFQVEEDSLSALSVESGFCPACNELIVLLLRGTLYDYGSDDFEEVTTTEVIYPWQSARRPLPAEVPSQIRDDFAEAAMVLTLSPKASAAISRRLLQHILREKWGIKHRSLEREIKEFVALSDVPSYVSEAVDAVRVVGNFAAHPLKDKSTEAIVDVEPGEVERLLDVLESLCDFSYVQPKRLDERKQELNAKLASIGKPFLD